MKLLIIEDNFELANTYRKELESYKYICDIAVTAKLAELKIKTTAYDLILLDLNLPDAYGIDVLKNLKHLLKDVGIIVITAQNDDELIVQALDNSADDFLKKPVNYKELRARINAVYRRYNQMIDNTLQIENINIDLNKGLIFINGQEIKLTNKEYLIFVVLVKKYPGYVTSQEISENIYDEYYLADSSAIRVHIFNLKKKLSKNNITLLNEKNKGYKLCLNQ